MGLLLHVFATSPFLWKRVADTPGRGEPPPLVPRARQSWLFCLSPSLCLRPSSSPAPPDLGEIPIHLHRLRLAARGKQGLVAVQIDIPSRQDRHDALARTGTPRAGEQRGHRGRARGFDDLLGVAREIAHPLPDSVIVDDDNVLDPRANDLERCASGDRRGETVRDRVDALEPLWRAVVERDPHRGRAARLDPDDAHTGPTFGQRDGEASAIAVVPADIVITPRSSACRGVARTAFTIPRGLNEPVTCRFSVLSQTGASTTAPSWVDGSSGVRRRYGAIRSRAAATSSTVTDRVTAVSRTRSTPAASRRSSPHSHPNPLYRVVRVPEPVPPRLIRLTMSIRVVGPREKRHRARITSVPGIRPLAPDIRPRLTEELGPIPRAATIDAELDAQHRRLAGPGVATHDLAATHEDVAVLRRRDDGPRRHRSERTPVDDVAIALEETAERPSQERQTREPFHGRHPVPARNDQPQGRTVLARKRLAVHLVGQQGVLVHRLAQRQRTFGRRTSAEVRDGSGVGAGAEHLDRRTCRAGAFEHRAQRRALPFRGPHRTEAPLLASDARLERGAAVAGAFERDRQRAFRPRPDLFQRQRLRRSTGPGASETPRP